MASASPQSAELLTLWSLSRHSIYVRAGAIYALEKIEQGSGCGALAIQNALQLWELLHISCVLPSGGGRKALEFFRRKADAETKGLVVETLLVRSKLIAPKSRAIDTRPRDASYHIAPVCNLPFFPLSTGTSLMCRQFPVLFSGFSSASEFSFASRNQLLHNLF
jgi:hypothetical protein